MPESVKHKCGSTGTLCEYCIHNDYKANQIKRCHEKGNRHKDVRHVDKNSVRYNSRNYRSRNKGFM